MNRIIKWVKKRAGIKSEPTLPFVLDAETIWAVSEVRQLIALDRKKGTSKLDKHGQFYYDMLTELNGLEKLPNFDEELYIDQLHIEDNEEEELENELIDLLESNNFPEENVSLTNSSAYP